MHCVTMTAREKVWKMLWWGVIVCGILLSPSAWACMPASFEELHFSTISGFPTNEVTAVTIDENGIVYVGTEDHGLIVLQPLTPEGNQFAWWNPDERRAVLQGAVHALFIDQEKTLWLGTTAGLYRVSLAELMNGSVSGTSFQAEDGLRDNVCLSIAQLPGNSTLWVGTTRGLVAKEAGFKRFTEEQGLPSNLIQAVALDPDNTVWAGTSLGLVRRSGFDFRKTTLDTTVGEINHWVYDISGLHGRQRTAIPDVKKYEEMVTATFEGLVEGIRRRDQQRSPMRVGRDLEAFIEKQRATKTNHLQRFQSPPFFVATNQGLYKMRSGSDHVDSLLSGWYTALAIDEVGSCLAADTDLMVRSAEPGFGLEISYDVKSLIRASIFSLVASAEVDLYEAQQRGEAASLTRAMNELLTQSEEQRAGWVEKWLAGKRVSDMEFNHTGQLWVGVKGGGVFRFNPVVVNHDAFAYALKGYNDNLAISRVDSAPANGFAVSVPSRNERIPPQIRQGIAYGTQVNPQVRRQWIGRWSDLPVDEARRLASLLGEFSHPACVTRFTGLVVHNPWVIVPLGDLPLN